MGNLGDPPCKELDIGDSGVIIHWLPGVASFHRDVLKRAKPEGSRRSNFVRLIEERSSPAFGGIQGSDEGLIF
jgi:cell division inhibitor SulA